ncbi:class I SAM-dependent methyltransferase [Candidatus Woesearchaeota archaeon]|nr:class I SAM-dependent methyltransferase [Candidatus Woesearchaeota archaeon]
MDYYSSIADGYNELYGDEQLNKVEIIIKELKIKNEKVLDIGCGTAFYSYLFKDYTGIDISKGLLKKANNNVIFGKAEKLQFNDKSFDVVICVTAIHNFDDPEKAILEMKRVSKGKIVITLLKRAKNFKFLKELIEKNLKVYNFEEDKDIIFIQDSYN